MGNWLRRTAKMAEVAFSYCHHGHVEYLISCGLWVKGMEITRALSHLGVLKARLQWLLETPNLLAHHQDTGGIPSPKGFGGLISN